MIAVAEIVVKGCCDPDTANRATTLQSCGAHRVESSRNDYDDADDHSGYTKTGTYRPESEAMTAVAALANYNISPADSVDGVTAKKSPPPAPMATTSSA